MISSWIINELKKQKEKEEQKKEDARRIYINIEEEQIKEQKKEDTHNKPVVIEF